MDGKRPAIWKALVGAAALMTFGATLSSAPPQPSYRAFCVVEADSVDGYVSNNGPRTDQVSGLARFTFVRAGSTSAPEMRVWAEARIPLGQTQRVAHAPLTFTVSPDEECRFDVDGILRPI